MVDIVDSATRSRMMRGIRGTHTQPERCIRRLLHRHGFRFRLHVRKLPGKPDIVLPRHRAVVFVHGCFWHGHDCPLFRLPSTRSDFWLEKINKNRTNDLRALAALQNEGWRVAIIWECALRGRHAVHVADLEHLIARWLRSNDRTLELAALNRSNSPA